MVHCFSGLGFHVALDVDSGAIHLLDALSHEILNHAEPPLSSVCPDVIQESLPGYAREEIRQAWAELYDLQEQGLLFSNVSYPPPPADMTLKALCLHVAHDCNLRCGYCFAHTGDYAQGRTLMEPSVACRAIDFLVARSHGRRNLEIDFFGGEPLLALDTVKQAVAYARANEGKWGKRFRFTITTNGLALDSDAISFINEHMDNVVLSLDGRPEIHDALRKTRDGKGSFHSVFGPIQALVQSRTGDYFVRGTFTARNLDFVPDVLALADLGFDSLSMEPVVLPAGHPLALREEHLPALLDSYERLTKALIKRPDIRFFHYEIDLTGGPCVHKRLRGCGAGFEYAAVTPEGTLFPCHQFVGIADAYRMGHVRENTELNPEIAGRFAARHVQSSPDCAGCWAKYFCSGGCAAANLNTTGQLAQPYALGCVLEKKRVEQAILLQITRNRALVT